MGYLRMSIEMMWEGHADMSVACAFPCLLGFLAMFSPPTTDRIDEQLGANFSEMDREGNHQKEGVWTLKVYEAATGIWIGLYGIFGGVGFACLPLGLIFSFFRRPIAVITRSQYIKKARELKKATDALRQEEKSGSKGRKWRKNVKAVEKELLLLEEDVKALEEMYPQGEKAETAWAMTVLGYLAKLVLGVLGGEEKANVAPNGELETEAKVVNIPSSCSMEFDAQTMNDLPEVEVIPPEEVSAVACDDKPDRLEMAQLYNEMCKVLGQNANESMEAFLANKPAGFKLKTICLYGFGRGNCKLILNSDRYIFEERIETSLLLLKFLVSLLLQAIWVVVEDTKDKLYLPLIMLIAFSIIIIVKVKILVRHDEMKILEEVAGSFLRFIVEAVEVQNYVGAYLCICPTVIAIIAVLSPPLDADVVLSRFFTSVYESIGGYFAAIRIETDGAVTCDGGSKVLPCTCGWGINCSCLFASLLYCFPYGHWSQG
ncbi:unnamed protein product [Camellia sinensis]